MPSDMDRRAGSKPDHSPSGARTARNGGYGTPSKERAGSSHTPLSPAAKRNNTSLRNFHNSNRTNSAASRIDPEQVPRPVGQAEPVREDGGKVYETNKYHVPPPAGAVCTIVDRGSCSCEFIRCTVNQVPAYPSTANTAHVPVAAICQAFAELTPKEVPVPIVNFGESGPLRCARCKAYINPFFTWQSQGRETTCNLCGQRTEVPDDYLCSLDERGQRRDHAERPELQRGTVDYVAPRDYSDERLPGKPAVAIVLDASLRSIQAGLFSQVLWTLRALIGFLQEPAPRIALIIFDYALHFYAFRPGFEDAHEITVADIEDPFVPCSHDVLCVEANDYRLQWEALLEKLPGMFAESPADKSAGGAALKAATELVAAHGGGHVMMFHGALPNTGVGALRSRDDIKLYSTPEAALQGGGLFAPQQAAFFDDIAKDSLSSGVAVSTFLCPAPNTYIDVATLSVVPRRTGGEVTLMSGFDSRRDGEQLHHCIARAVTQGAVYSCVFKFRCSKGLTVECMHATWDAEVIDQSTFAVSRLSSDSTCTFVVNHAERIEGQKYVSLQAACLHTDQWGRRLIRVHTIQLPVTTSLSNVFRYTEIDAVTNLVLKQAASSALAGIGTFKDKMTKSCVDMLHAYRVNCASMTSTGQLILPESLKLLPLYVGSIRKMAAFRSGSDIRVDDRMAGLIRMIGLPIGHTAPLVYPRVYTLYPLPERAGMPTGVADNVHMPPSMPCSVDKMANDRVFLVDNGYVLFIHVKEEVSQDVLWECFGVSTAQEAPVAVTSLMNPSTPEAIAAAAAGLTKGRIVAIVQQLRKERWRLPWQPLHVAIRGTPEEARLLAMLVEDRVAGEMHYVDFLCHVHKLVQNKA